jgi:hypothetical protein
LSLAGGELQDGSDSQVGNGLAEPIAFSDWAQCVFFACGVSLLVRLWISMPAEPIRKHAAIALAVAVDRDAHHVRPSGSGGQPLRILVQADVGGIFAENSISA